MSDHGCGPLNIVHTTSLFARLTKIRDVCESWMVCGVCVGEGVCGCVGVVMA